jgi:hypothetical protein
MIGPGNKMTPTLLDHYPSDAVWNHIITGLCLFVLWLSLLSEFIAKGPRMFGYVPKKRQAYIRSESKQLLEKIDAAKKKRTFLGLMHLSKNLPKNMVEKSQLLLIVTLTVGWIIRAMAQHPVHWMFPLLRLALYIAYTPALVYQMELLGRCLYVAVPVVTLLMFTVFLFGIIGVFAFGTNITEGQFCSLQEATWALLVMTSTANYPNIMMPEFHNNPEALVITRFPQSQIN